LEYRVRESRFRHPGQQIGGRFATGEVKAHVEGAIVLETEATRRVIHLRTGKPQVRQDAIGSPPGRQHGSVRVGKRAVHRSYLRPGDASDPGFGKCQIPGVQVAQHDSTARAGCPRQGLGMTTASGSQVKHRPARGRTKQLTDRFK
jgi:hypothetical protein